MDGHMVSKSKAVMLGLLVIPLIFLFAGCTGSNGAAGSTTGTISGIITAGTTTNPISGVTVSTNPVTGSAASGADGSYTLSVPAGSYSVTFAMAGYTSATASVNVAVGTTSPLNAALQTAASGQPSVTLAASGQNVGFSVPVTLTATATSPKGASLSYAWSSGAKANAIVTQATATTPSLATALGGTAAPSTDPGGYVSAYVQENRIGVLPFNSDTRGTIAPAVTVTDGMGGSTKVSVSINSVGLQPGLKNVAIGLPVYLNSGSTSTTTTWTVTGPSSSATYSTSTSIGTGQNPSFTPDVQGKYVVTATPGGTINIYAGKWVGVIDAENTAVYTSKTVTTANSMWYSWAPSSTSSSQTYTNWPVIQADWACGFCHNGTIAPDKITPWKSTAHASFFTRGLENITSNSDSCLTCHTTGYDLAKMAANDGFDDMMAAESFKYQKATGAWAAMLASAPNTARRANIQCENCHGPQDTGSTDVAHARISGTLSSDLAGTTVRVDYSTEVCAACHSSGTGHHYVSEWRTLNPDTNKGHSNMNQFDATGYLGHAKSTDGSCARCHTAEGFVAYVSQLATGNSGTLPASVITWTKDNAHVQTCTACHDPHNDTNENQLRISDSIQMTMAGFGVDGVGKGAICMACHNNRNGLQCASAPTGTGAGTGTCPGGNLSPTGLTFLHEDTDAYAPLMLDTPHDAAQAEVLMGRDFFFMGTSLPMLSKHANVKDTCVGCHMTLNPQTHLSHGVPATSSHVFYIKDADVPTLCANCHSSNVDGAAIQAYVEDQMLVLGQKMSANMLSRLPATFYISKAAWTLAGTTSITYSNGTFYFNGTPGNITSGTKATLSTLTTDAAGNIPVFGPNDILKKGNWNWMMLERDGSLGIHNPSFVQQVLTNSIGQF
ncbi:MAG TPA: carboxypeptidase-like regulatory domain-containing protein [Nitrospirota bacterium]|nr:carboxypeptidase-like regulatory domain-containing protein [Nitrospirota bacterium]